MKENELYERIRQILANAPRNQYTAELHLQMIKYADVLGNITSKEFCEDVGLKKVSELSLVRSAI